MLSNSSADKLNKRTARVIKGLLRGASTDAQDDLKQALKSMLSERKSMKAQPLSVLMSNACNKWSEQGSNPAGVGSHVEIAFNKRALLAQSNKWSHLPSTKPWLIGAASACEPPVAGKLKPVVVDNIQCSRSHCSQWRSFALTQRLLKVAQEAGQAIDCRRSATTQQAKPLVARPS